MQTRLSIYGSISIIFDFLSKNSDPRQNFKFCATQLPLLFLIKNLIYVKTKNLWSIIAFANLYNDFLHLLKLSYSRLLLEAVRWQKEPQLRLMRLIDCRYFRWKQYKTLCYSKLTFKLLTLGILFYCFLANACASSMER